MTPVESAIPLTTKHRYLLADETIDENDIDELIQWLRTRPRLTQGALVEAFERQWAEWLGVKYATFVNSGSSANLAMCYAALLSGTLKNRRIVLPAVSWATTVAPAIQLGFEPIMCEADENTFGLDANYLETLLKRHDPAAVIVVHVLGVPNDMASLLTLKHRHGFLLMEDACAALGSRYDAQPVGTFGDMSTFSFFYGHHLSTIEGGMVCTSVEAYHDILLQIRSHGWAKDLAPEKEEQQARDRNVMEFNRPFTFYYPGFNIRSTDLNARIGLSQMKKIHSVVRRRIDNHKIYQDRFLDAPGFHCQRNDRATICSISFAALAQSPEHRQRIARALEANNIETRPLGGGNMSRQPQWADRYGTIEFPVADRIHTTSFQLPNHPLLSPEDINYISDTVSSVKGEDW
ncbi:MAG: DegT/DnrJ/EryC1/StrS family aminotransferase [Candidatus Methylomirabilia bacterium]